MVDGVGVAVTLFINSLPVGEGGEVNGVEVVAGEQKEIYSLDHELLIGVATGGD
jgi:hypothetical protein